MDNTQACEHAQNMLDNLRTQIIQFIDQEKLADKK